MAPAPRTIGHGAQEVVDNGQGVEIRVYLVVARGRIGRRILGEDVRLPALWCNVDAHELGNHRKAANLCYLGSD